MSSRTKEFSPDQPIRWGIAGCGLIAYDFCLAINSLPKEKHKIGAVAARNLNKAKSFAEEFGAEAYYEGYDILFEDSEIDVIYIGTITSNHYELAKKAILANKPVLCEKPMYMSWNQSNEIIELARDRKILFVEGLWSKFLPSYDKLRSELSVKSIGEIVFLSISFGLKFDWSSSSSCSSDGVQIVRKELSGGTTLGLGCYALHLANLVFGSREPIKIEAKASLDSISGLDYQTDITLSYDNNGGDQYGGQNGGHRYGRQYAQISLSKICDYTNSAVIYGTDGFMELTNFWCCTEIKKNGDEERFVFDLPDCGVGGKRGGGEKGRGGGGKKSNYVNTIGFVYEIERVRDALIGNRIEVGEVSHLDSLSVARIQDRILSQIGIDYCMPLNEMNPVRKTIRWAIIGSGKIANDFALAFRTVKNNQRNQLLVAVAARKLEDAQSFANKFGISKAYGSYESIAYDENVDIVYISTVTSSHYELSKLMLSSGKAVVCEKTIGLNSEQTIEVLNLSKEKNLLFLEGYWSRFFPAYKKLREELVRGTVGDIKMVSAEFGWKIDWTHESRFTEKRLGGGVTLELGCYTLQAATMIFGMVLPREIVVNGTLNQNEGGVDTKTAVSLIYENGSIFNALISGVNEFKNSLVIHGTRGKIIIPSNFWCPTSIRVLDKEYTYELPDDSSEGYNFINSSGLAYEIDAVNEAYRHGKVEVEEMKHDDSQLIARMQDDILHKLNIYF